MTNVLPTADVSCDRLGNSFWLLEEALPHWYFGDRNPPSNCVLNLRRFQPVCSETGDAALFHTRSDKTWYHLSPALVLRSGIHGQKADSAVLPSTVYKAVLFLWRPHLQEENEVKINLEPAMDLSHYYVHWQIMGCLAFFLCFSLCTKALAADLCALQFNILFKLAFMAAIRRETRHQSSSHADFLWGGDQNLRKEGNILNINTGY
jgi:hypothetical protein